MDDCPRSAWFYLRHAKDHSTRESARGIIGHRAMAEILRTMREHGNDKIGPEEALQILYEVAAQQDVPLDERVRVPIRELDFLRMAIAKFAMDNTITIANLLHVEESFTATVRYDRPEGGQVERVVSARPDLVIIRNAVTLRALDWKFSWRPPAERRKAEGDDDTLTDEGYFQQRSHGLVLFHAFPAVQRVEFREFYPARTEARTASLDRWDALPRLEQEFALLVQQFDDSMRSGPPGDGWPASPGYHCRLCDKPGSCPIDPEVRGAGAIETADQADVYVGEMLQADAVRLHRVEALKPWVEEHGPHPIPDSKGERVLGWHDTGKSRRFETHVPD
jgi:hypothetical protein